MRWVYERHIMDFIYVQSQSREKGAATHNCRRRVFASGQEMVECMIGEKEEKKLDMIPVSTKTVSRRIDAMSEDILATLVSRVKKSEFYSLPLDECTDVANLANLLLYVRYLFEGMGQEDPIATRTTGEEILNLINVFMSTNGIDWERCVGYAQTGQNQ